MTLVLYGDFAVILGENEIASNLVADAISSNLVSDQLATLQSSYFGADGHRTRACISPVLLIPPYAKPHHELFNALLRQYAATKKQSTWVERKGA